MYLSRGPLTAIYVTQLLLCDILYNENTGHYIKQLSLIYSALHYLTMVDGLCVRGIYIFEHTLVDKYHDCAILYWHICHWLLSVYCIKSWLHLMYVPTFVMSVLRSLRILKNVWIRYTCNIWYSMKQYCPDGTKEIVKTAKSRPFIQYTHNIIGNQIITRLDVFIVCLYMFW